jgi:hypothetical protein
VLAAIALAAATLDADAQVVRFVNAAAPAGGNGLTWATAYNDLHSAIADRDAEQLWVSAGIYRPASWRSVGTPREVSFELRNGLAIYGGFDGTETALEQRDIEANATILSGDLQGDDGPYASLAYPPPAWLNDNSFHVVYAALVDATARLDGLTIEGGSATDRFTNAGGALYAHAANPTLENCVFTRNYAFARGAAIYLWGGTDVAISSCRFVQNRVFDPFVDIPGGAAIWCSASNLNIDHCAFKANRNGSFYTGGGGAIAFYSGELSITNSSFTDNFSGYRGASIYCIDAPLILSNCVFTGNFARWGNVDCVNGDAQVSNCEFRDMLMDGGCGVMLHGGTLAVRNCLFDQLYGTDMGGGLTLGTATALIVECDFSGCWAGTFEGGAIYMGPGTDAAMVNCRFVGSRRGAIWSNSHVGNTNSLTAINCLFSGNHSTVPGGAIELRSDWGPGEIGPTLLANCTFANNQQYDQIGGAISARDPGTVVIHNSILVHNGPNQLYTTNGAVFAPTFCMIEGGHPGEGNVDSANAGFADENGPDNIVGTIDDDLRLIATSYCIDAGRNGDVPSDVADLDADGNVLEPTPLDLSLGARFYDLIAVPNTGQGVPPIVDMGCYEHRIDCLGDVNNSGAVDGDDLITVILGWGFCSFFPLPCPGDANGSGAVDADDLIAVIVNWGDCP